MYLDREKDCMKPEILVITDPLSGPDRLYFSFFGSGMLFQLGVLSGILQVPFQISFFRVFLKFLLAELALPSLLGRTWLSFYPSPRDIR